MRPIQTLLLVLIFNPFALSAQEALATRTIAADLAREAGPLNHKFDLCVGAGRANEGLRADWQRQLAEAHELCGFRYIRFHGLLCDDMGVYRIDGDGREIYNWQYIDELFDYILETGMRPFVELGFMPEALASGKATIFWWEGNVTPPNNPERWQALIAALVQHWTDRYGEEEVARWYFEVWNEPNLSGFWLGDQGDQPYEEWEPHAREKYFDLYAITARAVKSVNERYRVGGPATAGNAWIPEFIDYCVDHGVPVDFVSTHHYAVIAGYLDETGQAGTVLSPDRQEVIKQVHEVREQIENSPRPGLELHYTEWSSSYTPSDPLHDSYHSAAFILHKIKGTGDAVQSMSYWTFTDIFEEAGPRVTPFHGGFGMINYQDIRKPSFYAYHFLHQLGDTELVVDDPDAWICKDGNQRVQALFWDFTITHPGSETLNQIYYRQDLPSAPAGTARLRLDGLEPGPYSLIARKVGYRANDAYTGYIDMGQPDQLSRTQVATLQEMSDGDPFLVETVFVDGNGTFERDFELRQNDVVLVTLERQ